MMTQNRNLFDDKPDELDAFLHRGFRYALALTHHVAQAEDLVQEACLRLLNRNMVIELPALLKTIRNRFIDTYEALGRIMPALDFEPHSPPLLNKMGLVLKGARYCSIQGHLALQMKFKDASGQRHTIYQAPCLPPLQGIHQAKLNIDNVQITLWQENGIFIGLASQ